MFKNRQQSITVSLLPVHIFASYLNREFYASDWIAFSLHFVSFISYFYIGYHWFPHRAPNS